MAIEEVIIEDVKCKNCGPTAIVRFGKYKDIQRYWCNPCHRKFKADVDLFRVKVPADYVSSAYLLLLKYERERYLYQSQTIA